MSLTHMGPWEGQANIMGVGEVASEGDGSMNEGAPFLPEEQQQTSELTDFWNGVSWSELRAEWFRASLVV